MYAALVVLWLLDGLFLLEYGSFRGAVYLCSGPVAALLLLIPSRRLCREYTAGLAALLSLALTEFAVATHVPPEGWSFLELVCLLGMLAKTCRSTTPPAAAVALAVSLGVAVIAVPYRLWGSLFWASICAFLFTFAVGAAVALGCYLRSLDARRARTIAAVRQGERMELARDLHDFVAHHVTGIVVQTDAARTVLQVSPDQVEPILEDIRKAGVETLDSMRRLVRVLREDDSRTLRPGELNDQLATLVSDFSSGGEQEASLRFAAAARTVKLAPEVETSVQRVVQEALTNVRRHAPGAGVTVRVEAEGERLLVEVVNSAPHERRTVPAGGRGGFGIVGLCERVEAVDGALQAAGTADGGWRVCAEFPVLVSAVTRSPA